MAALRGALSGWLQQKLGEQLGGGGTERGAGAVRTLGGERGSLRRGSGSGPRKSRLRGRGHAVLAPPPPPPAPSALQRGRRKGGGREEREL